MQLKSSLVICTKVHILTKSLSKLQAYFFHIKNLRENFLPLGLISPMLPEAVTD